MGKYIYQLFGSKGGSYTRSATFKDADEAMVEVSLWKRELKEDMIIVYEATEADEIHSKDIYTKMGNIWHRSHIYVDEDIKNENKARMELFMKSRKAMKEANGDGI